MNKPMKTILSFLASVNTQQSAVVNKEGSLAFHRSLQEQVLQVLSTGVLQNTFYTSREELAKEAVEVLTEARHKCPHFLARALVWAREEGLMKALPVLGLAVLSAGGGRTRDLFESAFRRVVKTPYDLRSFVEIAVAGVLPGRKGLGGMTVNAVRGFLNGMSEYHALKYGSAASQGVTLRDAIRMTLRLRRIRLAPSVSAGSLVGRSVWVQIQMPTPRSVRLKL
jgi:60 kDa SS-A/Ro ribonucleoprotein